MGAGRKYLIMRVAVPAAGPMIFIGLYAGLCLAFTTLIGAEMLGVRAGLGWYISWHQGWADYGRVYACLLILGILASTLIYLIFRVKDRLLVWQKGLIKW